MKRALFKWSIVVPLVALAVTIIFSMVGSHETKRINQEKVIWDYFAPAELVIHSINYPAAAAAGLLGPTRGLRIGVEYSARQYVLYLILVFLFWAATGLYIDWGFGMPRSRLWRIMIAAGVIAYSLFLVAIAFSSWDIYPPILGFAGLAWGSALMIFAVFLLWKDYRHS